MLWRPLGLLLTTCAVPDQRLAGDRSQVRPRSWIKRGPRVERQMAIPRAGVATIEDGGVRTSR